MRGSLSLNSLKTVAVLFFLFMSHFAWTKSELLIMRRDQEHDHLRGQIVEQIFDIEKALEIDFVQINTQVLRNNALIIHVLLFDDVDLEFSKINSGLLSDGSINWYGQVKNNDKAEAFANLTLAPDDTITGKLYTQNGYYCIIPIDTKTHVIIKSENFDFSCELDATSRNLSSDSQNRPAHSDLKRAFNLDAIVLYTPGAKNNLPGRIEGEIALAESEVRQSVYNTENSYYIYSQRFNIVHTEMIFYPETNGGNTDLAFNFLRTSATVSNLRNQYKADIVIMIMDKIDNVSYSSRGSAYKIGNLGIGVNYNEAYVVMNRMGLRTLRPTMAHEIGHLLGGVHFRDNVTVPTHGYFIDENSIATIMVSGSTIDLSCQLGLACDYTGLYYWSNPTQRLSGQPIGLTGKSDNATHLIGGAWFHMADLWLSQAQSTLD